MAPAGRHSQYCAQLGVRTFCDFARLTKEGRFWIRSFGPSCLDALLLRVVELVATLPDSQIIDSFRERSFLQLFE